MNLYKSFGSRMETWVAEQNPHHDLLENIPEDSSTSSSWEKNTRAESVDSGVETASTDTLFPASALSVDMSDVDSLASGLSYDNYKVLSSLGSASLPAYSTPRALSQAASPGGGQGSSILNQKLKQALLRSESRRLSHHLESDQPQTRHSLIRTESFSLWDINTPSALALPISDTNKRSLSYRSRVDQTDGRLEDQSQIDSTNLSPGLKYLEQVCQKLEDMAKKKLAKDGKNLDQAGILRRQHYQLLEKSTTFSGHRREQLCNEELELDEDPYGHFRPRSASDTRKPPIHLRKLKLSLREQQRSTFDLLDQGVKDDKIRVDMPDKSNKKYKLKIVSLKKSKRQK
ncbi:uncharacterized protein LOC144091343 [Stigmatopora argus]